MLRPVLLTLDLLAGAIVVSAPMQAQLRDLPACKPDDYKPWLAAVSKLDSLVRFIDLAKRRQVLNPSDVQDNKAVNRAVGTRFTVADMELGYNCLDVAGEQYQAIRQYGLAISASGQLRALYGIGTVRARRPR
jgi:hypothetical protein